MTNRIADLTQRKAVTFLRILYPTVSPNRLHLTLVVIAVLVTMLLIACGGPKEALLTVPAGARAGDLARVEPCTYVTGDVEYAAECGTLSVPENRSDPNTRLIALPVTRIPAKGNDPREPIFWLNGGPGQSNMRFSHPQDLDALLEEHDFVLAGYRGVDGQVVLDCPEISEVLQKPPGDLLSDVALESYGTAAAQCAARLQAEGVDLDGYSMTETIDDMEAVREALDYERINLLGASYGTRLAMMYEWMYPQNLQRVAMIGVNPPGAFIWDAQVIDAQIGDYASLCAEDVVCGSRSGDLVAAMGELSQEMPERWLFLPIDEDKVKLISFIMFTESIQPPGDPIGFHGPTAVDMWQAAAEGDTSGMALASLLNSRFLPNFYTWGHTLAMGGGTGEYSDPDRDYPAELDPPDAILGAPFSLLMWSMGQGWPTNAIPEEYHTAQPSDVDTLLESGSVDFMNPPQDATEQLLPNLSNGRQIILKEFGHGNTFWNSQPEARVHMLTTYFDSGESDDSLYTYQSLDFDVGGGLPGLAKTVLAIVAVVVIVLLALVAFSVRLILRRVHRRRGPVKP
jgi:pimeloyl-ACP methyl ester carboxylesterase